MAKFGGSDGGPVAPLQVVARPALALVLVGNEIRVIFQTARIAVLALAGDCKPWSHFLGCGVLVKLQ